MRPDPDDAERLTGRFAPEMFERTVEEDAQELAQDALETKPCLFVIYGNDRGKHFQIEHPPVTIGRSPSAGVMLNDNRISRVHCSLSIVGKDVFVEDHNSRNGTYVDGNKVARAKLSPDSELRVGRTIMRVARKAPAEIEFEVELFRAAITDPLTGIPNRRWFTDRAVDELATALRHSFPLAAVFIDIDHFKRVNDTHGHQAGDFVLRAVAEILDDSRREEDLLCRYGGEEFVLMLRHTAGEGARSFCERVRAAVEQHAFRHGGNGIVVTISVGTASVREGDTLESLLGRADAALYRAKEGGRNRVETESDE